MTQKMTIKPKPGFFKSENYRNAQTKVLDPPNRLYIHVLKGISGIGKTQIGHKLISEYRDKKMDGFEVQCSDDETMQNSIREIMNYKGLNFPRNGVEKDLLTIADQIVPSTEGKHHLVLFLMDNPEMLGSSGNQQTWFWKMVESVRDYHRENPDRHGKKVVILITTRDAPKFDLENDDIEDYSVNVQEVKGFNQEETKIFLKKKGVAEHILEDPEDMSELYEMYQGHPMSMNADLAIFKRWGDPDDLKLHVKKEFRMLKKSPTSQSAAKTITNHLRTISPIHLEIWKILALYDQGNLHKDILLSVVICYIKANTGMFRDQFLLPTEEEDDGYPRAFYDTLQRVYGSMVEEMMNWSYISELRESKNPQQIYVIMHPLVHESLNSLNSDDKIRLRLALIALSRVVDIDNRFHYTESAGRSKLHHTMKHSEAILLRVNQHLVKGELSPFEELAAFELASSVAYAKMKQPSFKHSATDSIRNLKNYVEVLKNLARNKADQRAESPNTDNDLPDLELVAQFLFTENEAKKKVEADCEEFMKFRRFSNRDIQESLLDLNSADCYVPNLFLRIGRRELNKMRESAALLPLQRFMEVYPLEVWAQMLTLQGHMHLKNDENTDSLDCYEEALQIYKKVAEDARPPKVLLQRIVLERDHILKDQVKKKRDAATVPAPSAAAADQTTAGKSPTDLLQSYEDLRGSEEAAYEKGYRRSRLCKDNYHLINCYECILEVLGCVYHVADTKEDKTDHFKKVKEIYEEMKNCIRLEEHSMNCYAYAIRSLAKALALCGPCGRKYAIRVLALSLNRLHRTDLKKLKEDEVKINPHPEMGKAGEILSLLCECKRLQERDEITDHISANSFEWLKCLCLEEKCQEYCLFVNLKEYLDRLQEHILRNPDKANDVLKLKANVIQELFTWAISEMELTEAVEPPVDDEDDAGGTHPQPEQG